MRESAHSKEQEQTMFSQDQFLTQRCFLQVTISRNNLTSLQQIPDNAYPGDYQGDNNCSIEQLITSSSVLFTEDNKGTIPSLFIQAKDTSESITLTYYKENEYTVKCQRQCSPIIYPILTLNESNGNSSNQHYLHNRRYC